MTGPVFDHDLPRSTYDRLGQLVELLTDIRDRLPAPDKGGQPEASDSPQPVKLVEPKPPADTSWIQTTEPERAAKPAKKATGGRRRTGG